MLQKILSLSTPLPSEIYLSSSAIHLETNKFAREETKPLPKQRMAEIISHWSMCMMADYLMIDYHPAKKMGRSALPHNLHNDGFIWHLACASTGYGTRR